MRCSNAPVRLHASSLATCSIDTDISLPLDQVVAFLAAMEAALPLIDPGADSLAIAHLGDGNIHYTVFPTRDDPALSDAVLAESLA